MNAPPLPSHGHAVVCGGSMAGLLSAGLLARHCAQVTILERDRLEDSAGLRKGVPQGAHTHILLRRGMDLAARIFPGLPKALREAGAQTLDMSEDCAWFVAGIWRRRIPSGVTMSAQTRPLLEHVVRTHLRALPNVQILDGREASNLRSDGKRVTGVEVRALATDTRSSIDADLVVDASGRGSRTPQWLEALGVPRVQETHVKVDVGYATRLYQIPEGFEPGWRVLSISPDLPVTRRAASLMPVEGNRWTVTLGGWLKDYPPGDDAGFLEFARSLPQPHLYEALRNAEPMGPAATYRFSHNQWRHYEKLAHLPEGLVVVGDAFCSFNPIYGQGMTTAALQVEALESCLQHGREGLSQRYFRSAGRLLSTPWAMATGGDLRLPEVEGKRMPGSGVLNWYSDRFQRLTATDADAVRTFMRLMHMLKPPTALFSPALAWKVLFGLPSRPVSARPAGLVAPLPRRSRRLQRFSTNRDVSVENLSDSSGW